MRSQGGKVVKYMRGRGLSLRVLERAFSRVDRMFVLSLLEEFDMVEWKGRSGSWEDEVRKLADRSNLL